VLFPAVYSSYLYYINSNRKQAKNYEEVKGYRGKNYFSDGENREGLLSNLSLRVVNFLPVINQ
jgi:hypothetical protein